MTKTKVSAHDRFTRSLMEHPKVIEEFFQKNLPQKIKEIVEFSSIQPRKESYIDDNLKIQIVDMLFEAKFNGGPGFIYLLFEHSSTPQRLLPFRILKYMIAIMDQHLETYKGGDLPFVYPMILYTGEKPYKKSMNVFDLFSKNERDLAKEMLYEPYQLIDLTQISEEDLEKYLYYGTMARFHKHIYDPCINPFFENIIIALKMIEEHGNESYINTIITYVTKQANSSNKEDLIQSIKKLSSVDEEKLMTLAEYLKEKTYNKGREEGRYEGLEYVAKNMLAEGLSFEKVSSLSGLSLKKVKALHTHH